MPVFQFKAYDQLGKIAEGTVEAANQEAALEEVAGKGLYPFYAAPEKNAKGREKWWNRELIGGNKISLSELSAFTRELATLLGAEITLDDALRLITAQTTRNRTRNFASILLNSILEGSPLSEALEQVPQNIPSYYASIVKAGEMAGSLAPVLEDLAGYLERQLIARSKILSSLIYPMILLGMAILATTVIVTFLVPNIAPLLDESGSEMPLPITLLMAADTFISAYWPVLLIFVILLVLIIPFVLRKPAVIFKLDGIKLKIPVAGNLITRIETARFARLLSLLLKNGVPLITALELAAGISTNRIFSSGLRQMAQAIRKGESFVAILARTAILPSFVTQLISAGEKTGKLENVLSHVANILEGEVQRRIDRFIGLLTPALTLLIGLGVGSLIISVMNAVLSINDIAL